MTREEVEEVQQQKTLTLARVCQEEKRMKLTTTTKLTYSATVESR